MRYLTVTDEDAEGRRFVELENSLHSREGSTTLIATVASSASVVLLSSFNFEGFSQIILLVGFFFPVIGEVYRELTITSIDAIDYAELRTMLPHLLRDSDEVVKRFKMHTGFRRGAIRLLLLLPSLVWGYVYWRTATKPPLETEPLVLGAGFAALVVIVLVLGRYEEERRGFARCLAEKGTTVG